MATFNGPDQTIGTDLADIFNGSNLDDVFYALEGNDTLNGETGNDALYGYQGNDSIQGGEGNDSLYGDEDNDWVNGGAGNDLVTGGSGNDTLVGNLSFDSVGIDTLRGGEGADIFYVGDYHNNLYGNAGDGDYAFIKDLQADDTIQLDAGTYELSASPISGISGTGIFEGSELIAVLEGVNSANLTISNAGSLTYITGYRDTQFTGTSGDDNLMGESSDDILDGREGNDTLIGVTSSTSVEIDQLIGGVGADTFVLGNYHDNYYDNAGNDDYALIKDFQWDDRILLDRGTYQFSASPISGISGTGIFEGSELIAVVEGVDASDLVANDENSYTNITLAEEPAATSVIIEAEHLNLDTYVVQDFAALNSNNGASATGISLFDGVTPQEEGTASLLASDYNLSGTYDLGISYFDENDGVARLEVLVNGAVVGDILLDEATSSGFPVEDNRREYTIEDLVIQSTDIITIRGVADINNQGSEWARVDYLSFDMNTEATDLAVAEV
jgi:Ca2+-binding RTX toxin-like protein